jgi:acetyl-CoA hydrolase
VYEPWDRVGSPLLLVDPRRIAGVVRTDEDDEAEAFALPTSETAVIAHHIARFLLAELRAGRLPPGLLPLQSGVGDVANAVLAALGANAEIPAFTMYTEVLQDAVIPLLEQGRCRFASTTAITLSPAMMQRFTANLASFRERILMRPMEISNHPEIIRRLGVISMNTALELDLHGNVNSTHVMGRQMMNGIGGSADFTRNAYLSIFSCPSTVKGGRISTVVPLVTHADHSEHSVQVVVTEQGVADLRGKGPRERAELIIARCAHPDYRPILSEYLRLSEKGHAPQSLDLAFALHRQFERAGDMRTVELRRS